MAAVPPLRPVTLPMPVAAATGAAARAHGAYGVHGAHGLVVAPAMGTAPGRPRVARAAGSGGTAKAARGVVVSWRMLEVLGEELVEAGTGSGVSILYRMVYFAELFPTRVRWDGVGRSGTILGFPEHLRGICYIPPTSPTGPWNMMMAYMGLSRVSVMHV